MHGRRYMIGPGTVGHGPNRQCQREVVMDIRSKLAGAAAAAILAGAMAV
jgi:hypothetical protein